MGLDLERRRRLKRGWRWFRWRGLAAALVFAAGLAGFVLSAGVSERPDVVDASLATKCYYALGLFVLGGMDLGTPSGGGALGRALLWFAYFAAPAITTTAVVEGVLRIVRPQTWSLGTLRGHVVIGGCGRLARLYLRRLADAGGRAPVVIVDVKPELASLELVREYPQARIATGDIGDPALLRSLGIERSARVLLLTGDDFTNLDAAAQIVQLAPAKAGSIVVHVSDLGFVRTLSHSRVSRDCTIFNSHQIAAAHLVQSRLLPHLDRTEEHDTVILAGFGRFGQSVLDELQRRAPGRFRRVIVIDREASQAAAGFDEQVGFAAGYARSVIDGDIRDPRVWAALDLETRQPVVVVGAGDDGANLAVAVSLTVRFPGAYIVARSFGRSAFADDICKERGFQVFSVADLVSQSIPTGWLS